MKELFETLYNIDVTKMKEKKGKFDYVSWPNAWRILATSDVVKSFEYKTRQKDRLINYEIEFENAFNEINNI